MTQHHDLSPPKRRRAELLRAAAQRCADVANELDVGLRAAHAALGACDRLTARVSFVAVCGALSESSPHPRVRGGAPR